MKIKKTLPPRQFTTGKNSKVTILDKARIILEENEQVTFQNSFREYDVVKKEWGFYATPSLNGRLKSFGYKTCICRNNYSQLYVLLVDDDKLKCFEKYIESEKMEILLWLDNFDGIQNILGLKK